jgi:hypothetical protein
MTALRRGSDRFSSGQRAVTSTHIIFTPRTHTLWKLFAAYRYTPFAFPQAHSGIALDASGRFRTVHLYLLRKIQTNKNIVRLSTRPGLSRVAHNQRHAA